MSHDICVIGAGCFGAWCAHALRRAGASVLLLEQHAPGHSRSSSGGESRIIRLGYGSDEIYTRMSERSLPQWRELFGRTGQQLFVQTGVLWLAKSHDALTTASEATLRKLGLPFDHITRDQLARRYPQIACDDIDWALYEPQSGILLARRAVAAVVEDAIRDGAQYRQAAIAGVATGAPARAERAQANSELETENFSLPHITTTNGEKITGGAFLFCCGPWLPKLFPALLAGRMFITRQEVFFFGTPPGDASFHPPQMPTWLEMANGVYGMPSLEGRGFKVALDQHGPAFDPDIGERTATPQSLARARQYLALRFPRLADAPIIESRVCQYENTSNGDFLIDRHLQFSNVWLVGGGSGHGFKHGPAIGEYAADLLAKKGRPEPRFSLATKQAAQHRAVF